MLFSQFYYWSNSDAFVISGIKAIKTILEISANFVLNQFQLFHPIESMQPYSQFVPF